ncbi:m29 [Muromegalovirus WP15B]|uniref:M29 n=1 Tax=Muromegalovirus WP15B TaxID=524651 RepID=B3UXF8_MUHV1|nr:m29 [Muromegalovirus WP15B]
MLSASPIRNVISAMWSSPKRRPVFLLTKAFTSSKELPLHALAQRNSSPLAWKLSTLVPRLPESKSTRCAVPVTTFTGTTGVLEATEVGTGTVGWITISEKAATGGIGGVGGVGAGSTAAAAAGMSSATGSPCSSSRRNTSSRSSSLMIRIPTASRLISTDFYLGSAEKTKEIEMHTEKKLLPEWLYAIARNRNAHYSYDRTTNLLYDLSWQIAKPPAWRPFGALSRPQVVGLAPLLLPHLLDGGVSPARFSDRDRRWLSLLTDRDTPHEQRSGVSGNNRGGNGAAAGGGCGGCVGGCGGSRRGRSDGSRNGGGYSRTVVALSFALGLPLGAALFAGAREHFIHKEVHPLDIFEGCDEVIHVRATTGECVAIVALAAAATFAFILFTRR